jgi:hypothetical protein
LQLIAVNREIHHTLNVDFVDRFCREKVLHQKLKPSFDDGLLTCCGFRCGFFLLCGGLL